MFLVTKKEFLMATPQDVIPLAPLTKTIWKQQFCESIEKNTTSKNLA